MAQIKLGIAALEKQVKETLEQNPDQATAPSLGPASQPISIRCHVPRRGQKATFNWRSRAASSSFIKEGSNGRVAGIASILLPTPS
jgi:hypothetical protein